jgi:hypothetical protein
MTDAREITVEEIDRIEWHLELNAGSLFSGGLKEIFALARRALSQEGGEKKLIDFLRFAEWPSQDAAEEILNEACSMAAKLAHPSPSVSVERERETPCPGYSPDYILENANCQICGEPPETHPKKADILKDAFAVNSEALQRLQADIKEDTPQSVPTCTCSKHPLWDGYDGDCPIHGWFEPVAPVAPDTPQSVPADGDRFFGRPDLGRRAPDAPLSQGEELADYLDHMTDREIGSSRDREKLSEAAALIASLIAERDKLKEEVERLKQSRDVHLSGEIAYENMAHDLKKENAQLVERVSVLERALEQYANMEKEGDPPCWRGTPYLARAALRTSEGA